jgi:GT2 family glycosyltransferase
VSRDIAVVTIVRGRLDHLAAQQTALESQTTVHERVVVQMGGPSLTSTLTGRDLTLVTLNCDNRSPLPLAAARNIGVAATAAENVLLLDVDCIPSPSLLARCADALAQVGGLVAGPVGYLPPGVQPRSAGPAELARLAQPHPARPIPPAGRLLLENRYELFWSLSFAVRRQDWDRIGGFCESYTGYGGEDTDFAYTARSAGIPLHWVGGAWAWHQYHPVSDPPREHLEDIVRNSVLFHRRWGEWPMIGWLTAFRDAGLIIWNPDRGECALSERTDSAVLPPESRLVPRTD